jgi:hypothetical protein
MNATPNCAAVPDDPDGQTLAVPLRDKRKRCQSFPLLLSMQSDSPPAPSL